MMNNDVIKSTCGICQIGCGVLIHTDSGRVTRIEGDPENPLNRGALCPKGLASLEYLYHPDRLKHPLKRLGKRGGGKWTPIDWDEALDMVADGLSKARDNHGVESVAFIGGSFKGGFQGRYLSRFANLFGSPNSAGQGHVCFRPRLDASRLTYGFYAIPDFDNPPAGIVVWGKNLAENLPHVYQREIKAVEDGAKLLVINSARTSDAARADLWLKPRPGSDLALALGMINVIIDEGLYDKAFVEEWTVGFDKLKAHVQDYTPAMVSEITWVPVEMIRKAARFYAESKPTCLHWGNAIDHGRNNFQTARALCILRAITGNLEIPGGELRWTPPPVIGHHLSPPSPVLSLVDRIPQAMRKRRVSAGAQLSPMMPNALPQGVVKAILDGEPYPIRAAYVAGCNPMLTYTNVTEVRRALLELDFFAVADVFMTPTAALADIVLPVSTYLEFDGIVAPPYSLSVVSVQQKVTRVGECRSDYEILRDLAHKLGFGEYFWDTEEQCLDFILEPTGISFREFRNIGWLVGKKHYRSFRSEGFTTKSGKVELYSNQLEEWGFDPLPCYYEPPETPRSTPELASEYPLVFTTGKCGGYRHSGGRQIASLRGNHPDPITYIHPQTAKELGIATGDLVYIETRRGKIKQKAVLTTDIDPRVAVVDYAWWFPERRSGDLYGWAEANINILTDDKPPFSREIGSPNMRGLMCRVYKVDKVT